jgi:hypothetical protein
MKEERGMEFCGGRKWKDERKTEETQQLVCSNKISVG